LAANASRLIMSAAPEAANVVETVRLSASELADDVDIAIIGRHTRNARVDDPSGDGNRKRQNPVRHRVFKTVCLYVTFGTMVRYLERVH